MHARELVSALLSSFEPNYAEVSRLMWLPIGSIGPTRQRALRRGLALAPDPADATSASG